MLSSVSVEVSTGRGMDPSKGSGQGAFHSEGSVPAKGFVLGKGPSPSEGSVSGEGSVPGRGSGPFYIDGSVPAKDPVAVLGQGKGHGTMFRPRVTGVPVDQEFPIMTHFRFRRLLAFLGCTRFTSAFQALQRDVAVFLDLTYLQRLVASHMWDDAKNYLLRVIPYDHMGVEGRALLDFLVFMQSVDWHLVGLKAAEIVRDLITQTPEFSEFLRLPRLASDLHDVINVFPHGFRSRRICHVKKAGRVPGSVIPRHFLPKQKNQDAGQGKNRLGLTDPSAWLRASIDETLKAGTRTVLRQEHHSQYAYDEACASSLLDGNPSKENPQTCQGEESLTMIKMPPTRPSPSY